MPLSSNRWLLVSFLAIGLLLLLIGIGDAQRGESARREIEGVYTIIGPLLIIVAVAERRRWRERLQTLLLGVGLLGVSVLLFVVLITLGVIQ